MKPTAFCSLLLGLLQLTAITTGLQAWLGIHWSVTLLMAVATVGLPYGIGTILSIASAVTVWQWPLAKAIIVFVVPLVAIMALEGNLKRPARRVRPKRPASIEL